MNLYINIKYVITILYKQQKFNMFVYNLIFYVLLYLNNK